MCSRIVKNLIALPVFSTSAAGDYTFLMALVLRDRGQELKGAPQVGQTRTDDQPASTDELPQ